MLAVAAALGMIFIAEIGYRESQTQLDRLIIMGRVRLELSGLSRRMSEAESAQRGYLLTHDKSYFEPFLGVEKDVVRPLAFIRQAYEQLGDAQASQRSVALSALVNGKIAEMKKVVALHDAGQHDEARSEILRGVGYRHMVDLRILTQQMIDAENVRVAAGLKRVFDTLTFLRWGVVTLTVLSVAVLVSFIRQSRQLEAARLARQAEIQADRDRLELEVRRRTRELTDLAGHLETAREDERARLARDLHDELGSLLTAAKLDVARIRPKFKESLPDLLPRLTHLVETLNSGISLKRRIIEDLRPSMLSSLGLIPSLEVLCREYADRLGIPVRATLEPLSLSPKVELTVFRMIQESLTNAAKHAKATSISVSIHKRDGCAHINVIDDGQGFDPVHVDPAKHGLLGMRYRVEAEAGELEISSVHGHGTHLKVKLPLSPLEDRS